MYTSCFSAKLQTIEMLEQEQGQIYFLKCLKASNFMDAKTYFASDRADLHFLHFSFL